MLVIVRRKRQDVGISGQWISWQNAVGNWQVGKKQLAIRKEQTPIVTFQFPRSDYPSPGFIPNLCALCISLSGLTGYSPPGFSMEKYFALNDLELAKCSWQCQKFKFQLLNSNFQKQVPNN
ncbi:hypothetical protein [Taibaiella koreensis]|uniref:hypothetical protein n=1 Tax=Taibaiella koreensis TaxID=1268548 RepID=UPI0013C2D191|nr:hypothetical protein [Taibaiella koreensis]